MPLHIVGCDTQARLIQWQTSSSMEINISVFPTAFWHRPSYLNASISMLFSNPTSIFAPLPNLPLHFRWSLQPDCNFCTLSDGQSWLAKTRCFEGRFSARSSKFAWGGISCWQDLEGRKYSISPKILAFSRIAWDSWFGWFHTWKGILWCAQTDTTTQTNEHL